MTKMFKFGTQLGLKKENSFSTLQAEKDNQV